ATATSRCASAGLKPPRRGARRTTRGRSGRSSSAAGRQCWRTAEARGAGRQAPPHEPRRHARAARDPTRSTREALHLAVSGRRQPALGRLRAPAPARRAAPAREASVRASAAEGPGAGAPAPARAAAPARGRAPVAVPWIARSGSGPARASSRPVLLVEHLGDLAGVGRLAFGGRQQAHVLRHRNLRRLVGNLFVLAAEPPAPGLGVERLQLRSSRRDRLWVGARAETDSTRAPRYPSSLPP